MRAVLLFVAASLVACESRTVTCGRGTHEESAVCVPDRVIPTVPPPPAPDAATVSQTGAISIAIVMNGWEMWIGNDTEVPVLAKDDPSRYPGLLVDLRAALDKHKLNEAGPTGSLGMVITYADKPVIRVPMGPLKDLTGSKLGTQQDYFGATGVELVGGITLALAELRKVHTSRRALIVISDGNDTNNDAAKAQLEQLKGLAAQDGVQTFAIIYKAKLSAESNVVPIMIPDAKQIATTKEVDAALGAIRARL